MDFENIAAVISDRASIAMREEGVESADWDELWEEFWAKEASSYIKDKEPGWEILASEM